VEEEEDPELEPEPEPEEPVVEEPEEPDFVVLMPAALEVAAMAMEAFCLERLEEIEAWPAVTLAETLMAEELAT